MSGRPARRLTAAALTSRRAAVPLRAPAASAESEVLSVIEQELVRLLELVRSTISERETP